MALAVVSAADRGEFSQEDFSILLEGHKLAAAIREFFDHGFGKLIIAVVDRSARSKMAAGSSSLARPSVPWDSNL